MSDTNELRAVKRRDEVRGERGKVLRLLRDGGGFTAGGLAKQCGWDGGRSDMAVFRTSILHNMRLDGLVGPMDDKKPMIYVITDAGRALLSTSDARAPSVEEGKHE